MTVRDTSRSSHTGLDSPRVQCDSSVVTRLSASCARSLASDSKSRPSDLEAETGERAVAREPRPSPESHVLDTPNDTPHGLTIEVLKAVSVAMVSSSSNY
jgi:hypothetical protein